MNSPVRLGVSPAAASTPTGVFRGLRLYFHAGTLGCSVCLAPQLFLPVYLHVNVGPPGLPATACLGPQLPPFLESSLPQVSVFAPPTSLHECFFFNSLVVRLPCSLIFCQFWLLFVFKFVVLLLVVRGGTVCPPPPPFWD